MIKTCRFCGHKQDIWDLITGWYCEKCDQRNQDDYDPREAERLKLSRQVRAYRMAEAQRMKINGHRPMKQFGKRRGNAR